MEWKVEKMREEFAEWFEECTGWEPVEYPNHKIVAMCWLAWKASREAIEIVLPDPDAHDATWQYKDAVEGVISEAGLKVRSE
jgi:hypothetical protein